MKTLTKAEEEVMQHLWDLKKGFVKDILACYKSPKPAYNTISTIIRILEKKGFVSYIAYGKTHEYYPLISKKDYSSQSADSLLKNYFEGSMSNMISFFVKEKKLNTKELDEILKNLNPKK
jgi:predicted transcriptional regulator